MLSGIFQEDNNVDLGICVCPSTFIGTTHLRVVCGSFHVTMAELSSCDRTHMVCKTKTTYCLALCEAKFADLCQTSACCSVEIHVSYTKFLVAPLGKKTK